MRNFLEQTDHLGRCSTFSTRLDQWILLFQLQKVSISTTQANTSFLSHQARFFDLPVRLQVFFACIGKASPFDIKTFQNFKPEFWLNRNHLSKFHSTVHNYFHDSNWIFLCRADEESAKRTELEKVKREMDNQIEELREDLEAEKNARTKAEKQRRELSEVMQANNVLKYVNTIEPEFATCRSQPPWQKHKCFGLFCHRICPENTVFRTLSEALTKGAFFWDYSLFWFRNNRIPRISISKRMLIHSENGILMAEVTWELLCLPTGSKATSGGDCIGFPAKNSVHSVHSTIGSRMNKMIFRSFWKWNSSQKNTNPIYYGYPIWE